MSRVTRVVSGIALVGLLASPLFAQARHGDRPDRFQFDVGYFRLEADTRLRFEGSEGGAGQIDLEQDLGVAGRVDTFWVDASWRLGRRHQVKLAFTRASRERANHTIERDFAWGGENYTAGLRATTRTDSDLLGGYYRFAVARSDRFEIGPTIGVGYLWVDARIQAAGSVTGPAGTEDRTIDEGATIGSITGALGGYMSARPTSRLVLQGDYLYVRVDPEGSQASVTDWRIAAHYFISRHAGLGVQYKLYRYTYDRGALESELGGTLTLKGFQAFLTLRF